MRSRAKWVEYGEQNTKYFLGLEKVQARKKIMEEVKDENGEVLGNQYEIHDRQRRFFADLYSKEMEDDEIV